MKPSSLLEVDVDGVFLQVAGYSSVSDEQLRNLHPRSRFQAPIGLGKVHVHSTSLRFTEGVGRSHAQACRVIELLQHLADYAQVTPTALISEPTILVRVEGTLSAPAPQKIVGGCNGSGPQIGRHHLSQDRRQVIVVYRCRDWGSLPRHLDHIACDMSGQPRRTTRSMATHAD